MLINLDPWQNEILEYKGDIILCKGRRIGGTEIFSIKAAKRMEKQPGVKIVFVSLVEDQAKLCISVALEYLTVHHKKLISKGKDKPTLTKITLTNGSTFKVRPVGNTGNAVRGFDGDVLGVDEAPWQPKMMWKAARPIIATNDGEIWMWGTPATDEGYFWEQYDKVVNKKDPKARFKVWHKSTEEVLFNRPISESWTIKQREGAIRVLAEEKKDMTEKEYGNEFLGLFLSELNRFFSDEAIDRSCTLDPVNSLGISKDKFQGIDVGRTKDPSVLLSVDRFERSLKMFDLEILPAQKTTETARAISLKDKTINHIKIYIDSTGVGWGVYDPLSEDPQTKRKVISIENAKKSIDKEPGKDNKRKKTIFKEDLYNNLRNLMESGRIQLFDDPLLRQSLKSIQEERSEDKLKIVGNYSHITEALIRAAWCIKDKSLNPYIF